MMHKRLSARNLFLLFLWAYFKIMKMTLFFFLSLFIEIDECQVKPDICGAGICYNTADSYTCICDDGYKTDSEGTTCVGERSKVKL